MTTSLITLRGAAQEHLDIYDITQDLVVLKDGSACIVLAVSALNFGLLSEKEQDATIYAYAQLLNSLNFSIQIVISSRQKDISDYLALLDKQTTETTSPKIRDQLVKYRNFVKTIVRQGNVLDKKFFVAIPFSSLELGVQSTLGGLPKRGRQLPKPLDYIVERATISLSPKRDHLIRLFSRIGLRVRQLTTPELVQLFFDFYNRKRLGTKVRFPPEAAVTPPLTQL